MKMQQVSLLDWQKRFYSEHACEKTLIKIRWPEGFICPRCNSMKNSYITTRKVFQCAQCRHQVSITAGTLFHATNLPLVKWFWAIYLTASDKGGVSALRLAKLIGVSFKYLQEYLDEFSYRFNRRFHLEDMLPRFADARSISAALA